MIPQLLPVFDEPFNADTVCDNGYRFLTVNGWIYYAGANGKCYLAAIPYGSEWLALWISDNPNVIGVYGGYAPNVYPKQIRGTYTLTQQLNGYYYTTNLLLYNNPDNIPEFNSVNAAIQAIIDSVVYHPIHYSTIGDCTITGPLDAPSGQDCVVTVNPAQGWTFRGASGVEIIDALGEPVPFVVNGNSFSFTMPQF